MTKSGIKPAATARSIGVTPVAAGILPSQAIVRMIAAGEIALAEPVAESQVQPASLDLQIGRRRLSRAGELSAAARWPGAVEAR